MPQCIKESEFNPEIHVLISGPYTLAECEQNCGKVSALEKKEDCGCGKPQS